MSGALLLAGCNIVVLFVILHLFRRRDKTRDSGKPPNPVHNVVILAELLLLPLFVGAYVGRLNRVVISTVVWQVLFSGFGEEIKFRGYYQSRINQEFGRPFSFLGIKFGVE